MINTVFGDDSLSRSKTFDWFRRFKDGRQSTEDDPCSERPSTSKNDDFLEKIYEKVLNNRKLTVRELTVGAGITFGSCHQILTEKVQMKDCWQFRVVNVDVGTKRKSFNYFSKS